MAFQNARCVAAESLASDWAQNASMIPSVHLSDRQEQLRIPPSLVVLSGLAYLVGQPPHKCFERLQEAYYNSLKRDGSTVDGRRFVWSPNLMPIRPTDMAEMELQIQQRLIQLEQRSSIQADALVREEDQMVMINQKKNARKRRKSKNNASSTAIVDDDVNASDTDASSSSNGEIANSGTPVLSASMTGSLVEHTLESSEDDENEKKWTVVLRKKCSLSTPTCVAPPINKGDFGQSSQQDLCPKAAQRCEQLEESVAKAERKVMADKKAVLQDVNSKVTELAENSSGDASLESALAEANLPDHFDVLTASQLRIRELEMLLKDSNERLEQERHQFRKRLQKEQEASQDRMQALQLRLYIAETRLRTFEDALEQHNHTVANNVATPLSPGRRRSQSPLHSKILRQDG